MGGPEGPDEATKRKNRIDYNKRIKAAKTVKEKQELRKELNAINAGKTTPTMDSKAAVAAYDPLEGVPQSKEMLGIHKTVNAKDVAIIARIQAALVNATGNRAKTLLKQFDKVSARLNKNIASQAKVINDELVSGAAKAKRTYDLSLARFEEYKKQGNETKTARQAAIVRADEKAKTDAAAKVEAAKAARKSAEAIAEVTQGEKQDKAVTAEDQKDRDDMATRLSVDLTVFKNEIFNDNEIIKEAKKDIQAAKVFHASQGKSKENDAALASYIDGAKGLIKEARQRIKDSQQDSVALASRIASIKTNAPFADGGFGGGEPSKRDADRVERRIVSGRPPSAYDEDVFRRLPKERQEEIREKFQAAEAARRAAK